jgi:hypothetical protein
MRVLMLIYNKISKILIKKISNWNGNVMEGILIRVID